MENGVIRVLKAFLKEEWFYLPWVDLGEDGSDGCDLKLEIGKLIIH